MTNSNTIPNIQWDVFVSMTGTEILDICPLTDTDFSQITSNNGLKPDRGFLIKLDIPYDLSCRRYEN